MEGNHHIDEVIRHSKSIRGETEALIGELKEAADQINRTVDLKGRVERHPWGTLATAMAVGFVLGGGLFSKMTLRLLIGSRFIVVPLVRSMLETEAHGNGSGVSAH